MKLALCTIGTFVMLLSTGCATGASSASDSPPPSSSGDAGAPKKDAGSSKTPPDSGAPSTDDSGTSTDDDGGTTTTDDSTCAATTTMSDCEQCCIKVHPSGYDVYHQELIDCACTSPGDCASACANEACANQPTTSGDACEQCMTAALTQGTGSCYDGVSAACQGDVDCTALFGTCMPPCESKP